MTYQQPFPSNFPQQQPQHQVDPMVANRAMMQYEDKKKSTGVAWVLWVFLGGLGGHRYYLGDVTQGIFMTITLGGLGFWTLIDAFFIQRRLRTKNAAIRQEVFAANGIYNMA